MSNSHVSIGLDYIELETATKCVCALGQITGKHLATEA